MCYCLRKLFHLKYFKHFLINILPGTVLNSCQLTYLGADFSNFNEENMSSPGVFELQPLVEPASLPPGIKVCIFNFYTVSLLNM